MSNTEALILCLVVVGYFLPAFVANVRRHRNATAILVLNLFLGWTFIGWVGALVWSFTNAPAQPPLNG